MKSPVGPPGIVVVVEEWTESGLRGRSPKESGPDEEEEGEEEAEEEQKLLYTYCLGPASIRSPQTPEKVSYTRSDKAKLIGPPIPSPQEWDFVERCENFLPPQPTTRPSIPLSPYPVPC